MMQQTHQTPWQSPHPEMPYAPVEANPIAAEATAEARHKFIERTYLHLALAIGAFVLLEAVLQSLPGIDQLAFMMVGGRYSWLMVLGAFIGVSWLADHWAANATSLPKQYAGLILYTLAEAVIFVPLIFVARVYVGPDVIWTAGSVTLAMFAGLTGYVFITKQDFSFMRGALAIASVAALGLVFASAIFGFNLGLLFSVVMVALASGYILYYTSNILHHYRVDQHVAAALALFSAVALLFWYVLRIFMSRD